MKVSSVPAPTSRSLNSTSILTTLRTRVAGEWQDTLGSLYHLALWEARGFGEAANEKGVFVPYRREPGSLSLFTSGGTLGVRAFNTHRAIFCHIRPQFLQGIEAEMDVRPQGSIHDHLGFTDPALRDLLQLLAREAKSGGENGELYSDSLHLAVGTRLLRLGRDLRHPRAASKGALPRHLVRRCAEFMESNLDSSIDIATLAQQTGYSRVHFMKMFTAATGLPPHRFLLHLRLDKAKALILADSLPLVEVAAICGFSSQAHLTTAFRRRYSVTPGRFARSPQKSEGLPKAGLAHQSVLQTFVEE